MFNNYIIFRVIAFTLFIALIACVADETQQKKTTQLISAEKENVPLPKTTSNPTGADFSSPAGYDFSKPQKVDLIEDMAEVSGLEYVANGQFYAIADNRPFLYRFNFSNPNAVQKWNLGKSRDYEGLAAIDNTLYILNSNGDIIRVNFNKDAPPAPSSKEVKTKTFKFSFKKRNEFESFYWDAELGKLILICKDCEDDKKKSLSVYAFDPKTEEFSQNPFSINVQSIATMVGEENMKFKPSAATLNPLTGELYIVSSINKLLVITDRKGVVKSAHALNPNLFKKPEGIAFAPNGDLYISNEWGDKGRANILKFNKQ